MNKEYIHIDTKTDEPLQNQIINIRTQQIKEETELEINEFINQKLKEKDKEIERLNNVINELEKWLESEIKRLEDIQNPKKGIKPYGQEYNNYTLLIGAYDRALDKLKELKGKNND